MEGNRAKPRAILVFGAPCSGKSTFAENFAKKYSLSFYDLTEIRKQNKFTHKNILTIVELLTRTRKNLILEGELGTEKERMQLKAVLAKAKYDAPLVWVQTDTATIRSRLKAKFKNISEAKEEYNHAMEALEAPSEAEKAIILSGKHTFNTQAQHVLAGLANLDSNDRKR